MLPELTALLWCAAMTGSSLGITFPTESEACLRTDEPLVPCVMTGAVGWAEKAASREIHLGQGLVLVPDGGPVEDLPGLGDPRETRTLVEAMERAIGQRRLVWGLGWLYPGLAMLVTRGPDPRLYFAVDGRAGGPGYAEDTGRLLVRRTVVPLLLGVNLKLASLAPLLVAVLVLLMKKALALSKLSLLVSGLGLFRQQQQQQQQQQMMQQHPQVTLEGFPGTRDTGWTWQQDHESPFNLTESFF